MTKTQIKEAQHSLNVFTHQYLKGVAPLQVDGVMGHATRVRIQWVKWYCGYGKVVSANSAEYTAKLVRSMRHQHGADRYSYSTREQLRAAYGRRINQRLRFRQQHVVSVLTPGVTTFDGVPVAKCAVPILQWARKNGWKGRLVSGWRSAAHSIQLCRNMCGADFCAGRCAGASTNHTGTGPDRFALDVSDYWTFRSLMTRCPIAPHIHNELPQDPVHFSPSGR